MRPTDSSPDFFTSARWPAVVIALLLGHVTLMMICVTLSLASPARDVSESYSPGPALSQQPGDELPSQMESDR